MKFTEPLEPESFLNRRENAQTNKEILARRKKNKEFKKKQKEGP